MISYERPPAFYADPLASCHDGPVILRSPPRLFSFAQRRHLTLRGDRYGGTGWQTGPWWLLQACGMLIRGGWATDLDGPSGRALLGTLKRPVVRPTI